MTARFWVFGFCNCVFTILCNQRSYIRVIVMFVCVCTCYMHDCAYCSTLNALCVCMYVHILIYRVPYSSTIRLLSTNRTMVSIRHSVYAVKGTEVGASRNNPRDL